MIHLDLYDVLAVTARVLRCDSAAVTDRVELDRIHQVLADVRRTDPTPGETANAAPATLAEAAATLLAGLVWHRPFRGPGRQVSVTVTLQFLALNNHDLELEPIDELNALLDQIATHGQRGRDALGHGLETDDGPRVPDGLLGGDGVIPPSDAVWYDEPGATAGPEPTERAALVDWIRPRLILGEVPPEDRRPGAGPGAARAAEGTGMFQRFSERARWVVVVAQQEARDLHHDHVGTEHLLLGLVREGHGIAAKALSNLGISEPAARSLIEHLVGRGGEPPGGHIPFTPRAKIVLDLAHRAALQLGQNHLGTEHILLGLIREGHGVAADVLARLGADRGKVRQQVINLLGYRLRAEDAVKDFLTEPATPARSGRRHQLQVDLADLLDENDKLYNEVGRLRRRLRDLGLDPDA